MGKWEPVFWIVFVCGTFLALLLLIDFVKAKTKRRPG
jgi:hypothetical protein